MQRLLRDQRRTLDSWSARLNSLSHQSVLSRGFVLVYDQDGKLVRDGLHLASGSKVDLEFADARRRAIIDGAASVEPAAASKPKPLKKAAPKPKKPKPRPEGQGTLF